MAQVNDLSRSLTAFDPISTLVVVVEMSKASWLVSGVVPGVERQPLKKLEPDATALLRLIERWRNEAVRAGRPISRIALAYEAEEITTALSRFKGLFVIARNSSFTFKGKAVDIKEVGRSVRYVLEGEVRKASGKVRITGRLIEAATGTHIWADRFERDMTDIFALQDDVTLAIVSAIQPKLFQAEIALASRRRAEDLTAYDLYLRAIQQAVRSTRESLAEALRLVQRALELDPGFAGAAALAGACHMENVLQNYAVDPQLDRKEAVRLMRLALSLDDGDQGTLATAALISALLVGDCETETAALIV